MKNYPATQADRILKTWKINFRPHLYPYEKHGGTHQAAFFLNVPEHQVIKTLVMEMDSKQPLLILMHGDCEVSTKKLASELNKKLDF